MSLRTLYFLNNYKTETCRIGAEYEINLRMNTGFMRGHAFVRRRGMVIPPRNKKKCLK